jgi:hypothetical protein
VLVNGNCTPKPRQGDLNAKPFKPNAGSSSGAAGGQATSNGGAANKPATTNGPAGLTPTGNAGGNGNGAAGGSATGTAHGNHNGPAAKGPAKCPAGEELVQGVCRAAAANPAGKGAGNPQ